MPTARVSDADRIKASHAARLTNRAARNRVTAALRLLRPELAGLDDNAIFERLAAELEHELRQADTGPSAA